MALDNQVTYFGISKMLSGSDPVSLLPWWLNTYTQLVSICYNPKLPQRLSGKESASNEGATGNVASTPGLGRSPEGKATSSTILAWRILWTEEPGWLQSIGSHRAGHDWSNLACVHACMSKFLVSKCIYRFGCKTSSFFNVYHCSSSLNMGNFKKIRYNL